MWNIFTERVDTEEAVVNLSIVVLRLTVLYYYPLEIVFRVQPKSNQLSTSKLQNTITFLSYLNIRMQHQ